MRTDIGIKVGLFHFSKQLERKRIAACACATRDQHVQPPMALRDAGDHGLHGGTIGEVGGLELGAAAGGDNFLDDHAAAGSVAAVDDDVGATQREFMRHRAANVGGCPGYQGNLVLQLVGTDHRKESGVVLSHCDGVQA